MPRLGKGRPIGRNSPGPSARNGPRNQLDLVEHGNDHGDFHPRTLARRNSRPKAGATIDAPSRVPYSIGVTKPDEPTAPAYAKAGVDLDHDESFIDEVKEIVRTTHRPEVLSSIGGFEGLFKTPDRYKDPVLVAATDGVGTKIKLAAQIGRFDTIGVDCVAMVVQGAEPLIFLDYIAMAKLEKKVAGDALRGLAEGCRRAGCALLGGETATMPGVYSDGELEMVGFSVGVVEREGIIDGSTISEGDRVIGLSSSGFHSNGYSLVRNILDRGIETGELELFGSYPGLKSSLASELLAPTRIYVKPILNLLRDFTINGLCHITGGGFDGNIPRVLPRGVRARINPMAWPRPGVYEWIQRYGDLDESELLRVFNCGIGMVLVVPENHAADVCQRLTGLGERAYTIGQIERKDPEEPALLLDTGFRPPT